MTHRKSKTVASDLSKELCGYLPVVEITILMINITSELDISCSSPSNVSLFLISSENVEFDFNIIFPLKTTQL